jgi:hypothetical protein
MRLCWRLVWLAGRADHYLAYGGVVSGGATPVPPGGSRYIAASLATANFLLKSLR